MENLFEYYIETDGLHVKYAKGAPTTQDQEFHDYYEFVFFIQGKSYLISKNIQQELAPGSLVLIPKEHFHQFCVRDPEEYFRCILGFRENSEIGPLIREVMDVVRVLTNPDERTLATFGNLIEIMKSGLSDKEKALYSYSSLVQLLIYFKQNPSSAISCNMNMSSVVSRALSIIDERYTENLSVSTIADLLYVSPSTLAHKFSKELGISIYRYITKKRLSVAHKQIQNGESLTCAAQNSGFSDYSCFYRLYRKYYASNKHQK